MERITVPWMELIRARMKEFEKGFKGGQIDAREWELINVFINPIMAYGEACENRITEAGGVNLDFLHHD